MDDSQIDAELAAWDVRQSAHERDDPLWGLVAYRLARMALDLAQHDVPDFVRSGRADCVDQLLRAVASVSANIAEGYSRMTPADRARFYSYALGSAREAIAWYASLRSVLGESTTTTRVAVLARSRRLVYGMLKSAQRVNPRASFSP